jgi:hypothetical protein
MPTIHLHECLELYLIFIGGSITVSILTIEAMSGIRAPAGTTNFLLALASGANPDSRTEGDLYPGVEGDRGVMLTTHPLLVPRLRKIGAIPPLTQSAPMACNKDSFNF